jgi:ABC-type sugar transport system ATPase subunit
MGLRMMTTAPAVRFEAITKRFPGVSALDGVTLSIAKGSCHAVCGENGAGKSTLGKILAGIHQPDSGRILIDGVPVDLPTPRAARAHGVGMVHQELSLADNLSVAENLCLGALPARGSFVNARELNKRARAMLEAVEADVDEHRSVGSLSVGEQQLVQIAAAVGSGAAVIVLDEPTSSLTDVEAERLFRLVDTLKARRVTLVYVSHRMQEIHRLCDTVSVLRDGQHVMTSPVGDLDEATLVQAMIGRHLEQHHPRHLDQAPGPELLGADSLSVPGKFRGITLSLRAGEVLGLAGLVGAGRTEVAHALFGLDPLATGSVRVGGKPVRITSPARALALGIGLVPEDRKRHGLCLSLSVRQNLTLPRLASAPLSRLGFVRRRNEAAFAAEYIAKLGVRTPDADFVAAGLSGGNQQKVVLARWLAARCRVLILDEPTRGVDVGAKAEIHQLIDELVAAGHAVLLISSELGEVIKLSTRVLVLRAGRMAGELARSEATQERIVRLMGGVGDGGIASESENFQ